ncbi:MAG TPA: ATP cone domain-containing protein, partial [Gemmataceae bacterium]|nr:ATP cone domain-containing protein [Gemmataceae bacterium]
MQPVSSLPVWIHKRDGRLVPFEADKISQSLFAASESLGRPDAFTARELTDGVLHFLCAELNGAIPQTGQVAEMTIKIVRELGQAAIAQAYADFSKKCSQRPPREEKEAVIELSRVSGGRGSQPQLPSAAALASLDNVSLVREVAATYLTNFSLEEIFTRDIAAAHRDGLITLTGLETPFEIQGGTLQGWSKPLSLALQDARQSVGQFIVLDGPEFGEASGTALPNMAPEDWVQDLLFGLRAQGLRAVVNLNPAVSPPWAQSLAAGPLFDPNSSRLSAEHWTERAAAFLEALVSRTNWGRVQWHLSEQDWTPRNASRTNRLARHLLQRAPITIAFDRTPRAISLSEGLDRRNSSLLISVGLNLPGLSRLLGDGVGPELFLQKLGSLARVAITAAVQKRRFITRYRRKQPAFLADRARLAVVPVGLESVTRRYTGQNILLGNAGADFASKIIR